MFISFPSVCGFGLHVYFLSKCLHTTTFSNYNDSVFSTSCVYVRVSIGDLLTTQALQDCQHPRYLPIRMYSS